MCRKRKKDSTAAWQPGRFDCAYCRRSVRGETHLRHKDESKADLAFTMHILSWLAVNGTAAIVEFPGVLYRGGAEQKIRKRDADGAALIFCEQWAKCMQDMVRKETTGSAKVGGDFKWPWS